MKEEWFGEGKQKRHFCRWTALIQSFATSKRCWANWHGMGLSWFANVINNWLSSCMCFWHFYIALGSLSWLWAENAWSEAQKDVFTSRSKRCVHRPICFSLLFHLPLHFPLSSFCRRDDVVTVNATPCDVSSACADGLQVGRTRHAPIPGWPCLQHAPCADSPSACWISSE